MPQGNYYYKDKAKGVFVLCFSYNDFIRLSVRQQNEIRSNFSFDKEKKVWAGKKKMDAYTQAYIAQQIKLRFEGGKEEIIAVNPQAQQKLQEEVVYADPPEDAVLTGRALVMIPSDELISAFEEEGKRKRKSQEIYQGI